jgi:DNA-binding GntR family transcriptional regulator
MPHPTPATTRAEATIRAYRYLREWHRSSARWVGPEELSTQINSSVPTARAALRVLRDEGLVTRDEAGRLVVVP